MPYTKAEKLFIDRRRRGHTQEVAAKRYRVTLTRYLSWERGDTPCPYHPKLTVRKHEHFVIMRRRAGLTQPQLAAELGCTVQWMSRIERGIAPHGLLERYWNDQH